MNKLSFLIRDHRGTMKIVLIAVCLVGLVCASYVRSD